MLEYLAIYFAFPLFIAFYVDFSPIFILIPLAASMFTYLYRQKKHKRFRLISLKGIKKELPRILFIHLIVTFVLTAYVYLISPELFFILLLSKPSLWLVIMIFYPLLSVYPQEVIFRTYVFERYRRLFQTRRAVITASAVAFSFAHIIYFHPISIILTLGGGFLFAYTYSRTKSVLIVSIEHALYGCVIFTIGLGRYFYHGFH